SEGPLIGPWITLKNMCNYFGICEVPHPAVAGFGMTRDCDRGIAAIMAQRLSLGYECYHASKSRQGRSKRPSVPFGTRSLGNAISPALKRWAIAMIVPSYRHVIRFLALSSRVERGTSHAVSDHTIGRSVMFGACARSLIPPLRDSG
ncbi:MAG: hypothetical protein QOI22_1590, partial [Verrucomicrobiota bacterium]